MYMHVYTNQCTYTCTYTYTYTYTCRQINVLYTKYAMKTYNVVITLCSIFYIFSSFFTAVVLRALCDIYVPSDVTN